MTQEPEWQLQAYVSTQLFRKGILHHSDQNAGKRGPRAAAQAKATGLCPGWPDMTIIQEDTKPGISRIPTTTYIEYKTMAGKLSQSQRLLHARMDELGIKIHTVYAATGTDAWEQTAEILGIDK